jgi:RNA polymerase sigma-70 factor, ECF subfamily
MGLIRHMSSSRVVFGSVGPCEAVVPFRHLQVAGGRDHLAVNAGEGGLMGYHAVQLGGGVPRAKVATLKPVSPGAKPPSVLLSRGIRADADDAALLAASAANDPAAFRLLVDRHLSLALMIARRMLRDDAEAEDVAQDALLRLWRGAATIDAAGLGAGGVRPWLRRVVSNLCIDRIRAGRRTDVTDEVPEQIEPATQIVGLTDAELAARVDQALQRLPERQRLALTLFHYQGLSQVEVGETMGVSDEAVESLLARARRTLKADLKDDWRALLFDDGIA